MGEERGIPRRGDASYHKDIFDYTWTAQNIISPPPFGKFSTLQLLNLAHLQNDLARIKRQIWDTNEISPQQLELLRKAMRDYVQAIRDLKYMESLPKAAAASSYVTKQNLRKAFPDIAGLVKGDPFFTNYVTLSDSNVVREYLRRYFFHGQDYDDWLDKQTEDQLRYYEDGGVTAFSNLVNHLANSLVNSIFAVLGGASLIAPMVIMVFNPSLEKSLITTSVAVVLFAFSVGFLDTRNILSLTMAYAAVLVVFVGTSGTAS